MKGRFKKQSGASDLGSGGGRTSKNRRQTHATSGLNGQLGGGGVATDAKAKTKGRGGGSQRLCKGGGPTHRGHVRGVSCGERKKAGAKGWGTTGKFNGRGETAEFKPR